MQKDGRVPVKFGRPPVMEVVCGIAFALPQQQLKSAHIGLYWSRVRDEFPRTDDAAPLAMIVEGQGVPESTDYNLQLEHVLLPPMRRAWLINADGTHLIQLQDDRFLFNWKQVQESNTYPSYEKVVHGFREHWSKYKAFLVEQGCGEPIPTQLEMTYFNFISGPEQLRDYGRNPAEDRFLSQADAVNWKTLHSLPDSCGRLHVSAATARHVKSGEIGVRLDLTARGTPREATESGCKTWFDLAHEWITHGFADITTPEAHKIWGRTA
jgi:uncharacterized protein (TIGR04255 family)